MSGRKTCLVIGLLTWLGSSAQAQGIVPGGWAPQFSYQSLNESPNGSAADDFFPPGGFGYGGPVNPYGGYVPYGYGSFASSVGNYSPIYRPAMAVRPPSGTVNETGGLIGAIRRTTRRPGR
jgi:hypothetical protein